MVEEKKKMKREDYRNRGNVLEVLYYERDEQVEVEVE